MAVKPTHFARLLQEARRRRGMTQAELATAAGMKQSAVSHFESGRRFPSVEGLLRLAEALEVPVDYLLGLDPVPSYKGRVSSDLAELLERLPKRDVELLHVVATELAKRQLEP